MEILVVSDWHGLVVELPPCNPDLVISLGDMYENCISYLDENFSCKKIGVLGNHDSFGTYTNTDFELIHEKIIEFNGFKIFGFNGSPRYSSKKVPMYDDEYVESVLSNIPYVDIFVAHANPKLDNFPIDSYDPHRGFYAFGDYIKEKQPKLFLHGHVHENEEIVIGNTTIHNLHPFKVLKF